MKLLFAYLGVDKLELVADNWNFKELIIFHETLIWFVGKIDSCEDYQWERWRWKILVIFLFFMGQRRPFSITFVPSLQQMNMKVPSW